jgi:hypothetical protein
MRPRKWCIIGPLEHENAHIFIGGKKIVNVVLGKPWWNIMELYKHFLQHQFVLRAVAKTAHTL